ncbi:MAG: hypothetical protein R2850_03975, partial [Bacteroidia bacterium]
ICDDSTALSATLNSGTGTWTVITGSATVENANDPNSNLLNMLPGPIQVQWSVVNGVCPAELDTADFVRTEPAIINAGNDTTFCGDTLRLNASISDGFGEWNTVSGDGFAENANDPNSLAIFNTGETELQLEWTSSVPGCPLSRDTIVLTSIPNPVISAGNDTSLCSDAFNLSAEISLGSGSWTIISGSADIAETANPASAVSNASQGEIEFVWSAANGACPAVSDTVVYEILDIPVVNAGEDQLICDTLTNLDGTSNVSGASWILLSGDAEIADAGDLGSAFTIIYGETAEVQLLASVAGCPDATDTVIITSLTPPVINAGEDQSICGTSAQLDASLSAGNGQWNLISGTGTIEDNTDPQSNVSTQAGQTLVLEWLVSLAGCDPVRDTVELSFLSLPTASAGADQEVCGSETQLEASGTGAWSFLQGSGILENANSPTSLVNSLSAGIVSLIWTVSSPGCPDVADTVQIVSEIPAVADAGADQEICSSSATLSATPATGGFWEIVSGSGVILSASSANTSVSGLSAGITTIRWVVPNSICPESSDTLGIVVNEAPAQANAGEDQSVCSTTTTLDATPANVGSGQWTIVSGNAVFTNANSPVTTVSALQTGVNVLRWTVSNGNCPSSSDEVTINVDSNPETAEAGENQEVCASSATLAATPPGSGTGTWSLVSGDAVIVSPNSANSQVLSLAEGDNVFRWTISGGSCGNVFDDVVITRYALPTTANAGNDQSICASSTTLSGNTPLTGIGTWSVLSGTAVFNDANNPISSVSGLSQGVNVFQWSISNGNCPPSADEVTITVDQQVDAPDAGSDQSVCSSSATLTALAGTGGTWSLVSGSGTIATPGNATTTVSGLAAGANVFRWTVSGGSCGTASDDVTITRFALLNYR